MFLQTIWGCSLSLPYHFKYVNLRFLLCILRYIFLYFWSKHMCSNKSWTLTARLNVNRFSYERRCDRDKKEIQLTWSHLKRITLYGFGPPFSNVVSSFFYWSSTQICQETCNCLKRKFITCHSIILPGIRSHSGYFSFSFNSFLNFGQIIVDTNTSTGGFRGARGARAPLWASKFFRFHAVFRKFWQNCVFTPPPSRGFTPPPRENPGFSTDSVFFQS